jgi:hypothetical protein
VLEDPRSASRRSSLRLDAAISAWATSPTPLCELRGSCWSFERAHATVSSVSGFAMIAIPVVAGLGLVGLLLVVTAFRDADDGDAPAIPQARIVGRGRAAVPTATRAATMHVSATRIVAGVMVMMFAGAAMMFLFGEAKAGDGLALRER